MEKAKYIEKKEAILFNELDNAHKKLKEIANWYLLSDYECNFTDEKNQKLYIQKVNNIYHELRNLLMATKKHELAKNLEELIVNNESIDSKLESLSDLENLLIKLKL